jgi:N-hydroxyarylamine O-acetyltransferase
VHKKVSDVFVPQYSFTKVPRVLSDFMAMCHYHQTSPESHFTQKGLCSLPTEHGRITLTGNVIKITEGDNVREAVLNSDAEIEKALWEYFRITI